MSGLQVGQEPPSPCDASWDQIQPRFIWLMLGHSSGLDTNQCVTIQCQGSMVGSLSLVFQHSATCKHVPGWMSYLSA